MTKSKPEPEPTKLQCQLAELNQSGKARWNIEDGKLKTTLAFKNFKAAFEFMNTLAIYAETADHHPDWRNSYNRIDISLCTHDAENAITLKDFDFALEVQKYLNRNS